MSDVRHLRPIIGDAQPPHKEDVGRILAELTALHERGQLRALAVGYIAVTPGASEDQIISDSAGEMVERVACASVAFRNETDSAEV